MGDTVPCPPFLPHSLYSLIPAQLAEPAGNLLIPLKARMILIAVITGNGSPWIVTVTLGWLTGNLCPIPAQGEASGKTGGMEEGEIGEGKLAGLLDLWARRVLAAWPELARIWDEFHTKFPLIGWEN